jgi:hypothetical protein
MRLLSFGIAGGGAIRCGLNRRRLALGVRAESDIQAVRRSVLCAAIRRGQLIRHSARARQYAGFRIRENVCRRCHFQ